MAFTVLDGLTVNVGFANDGSGAFGKRQKVLQQVMLFGQMVELVLDFYDTDPYLIPSKELTSTYLLTMKSLMI